MKAAHLSAIDKFPLSPVGQVKLNKTSAPATLLTTLTIFLSLPLSFVSSLLPKVRQFQLSFSEFGVLPVLGCSRQRGIQINGPTTDSDLTCCRV